MKLYLSTIVVLLCACQSQQEKQAIELVENEVKRKASGEEYQPVESEVKHGTRWGETGKAYKGVIVRHTFVSTYKGRPDTLKASFIVDSATSAVVPVKWEQSEIR